MNTRDLLELCQLDALGLLDEQEREEFDAAFSAAGPAIQAQIRGEQARLVKTDWIPCEAEPPAALRETVLGEMSLAMRVADLRPRILGAIHDEMTRRPALDAPRHHDAGRPHPPLLPVRRVSRLWRAAALGFASASVAFAGTTLYLKGQFDQLGSQRQQTDLWGGLGTGLGLPDLHFNTALKHVFFSPGQTNQRGEATLWIKPDAPARLIVWKLPDVKDHDYRVVALDEEGTIVQELVKFTSDQGLHGIDVPLPAVQNLRLAIVDGSVGKPARQEGIILVSDRLG